MPNYVRNIVKIYGDKDDIGKIQEICCGMDFNAIIPMPETLNIISGTVTSYCHFLYYVSQYGVDVSKWSLEVLDHFSHSSNSYMTCDIKTMNKYIESCLGYLNRLSKNGKVDEEHPYGEESEDISYLWLGNGALRNKEPVCQADAIALGRLYSDNIKNYGSSDWYSWSIQNWGTKWNPGEVDCEDDGYDKARQEHYVEYSFDTAWSFPSGIARCLAERLKEFEIDWTYADEDMGVNCAVLHKDEDSSQYDILREDEIDIANEVWGYDDDYFD